MRPWIRWTLIAVGGVILLGALVLGGARLYLEYIRTNFANQQDTRDLPTRIDTLANAYVNKRPNSTLVVGVFQHGQRHIQGYGAAVNGQAPDGNTIFEVGSITKVFTGIALSQQLQNGRMELDAPITQYLPAGTSVALNAQTITLRQLATHTSGLPRLPTNLDATAADPYATYRPADLYASLQDVKLNGTPGSKSEYSNYAVGLLGHLVELRSGTPYATLIEQGIAAPLGMQDTKIRLADAQRTRLAPGHDPEGNAVPGWTFDVLAPAGALHSSTNDMLTFLEAQLNPGSNPLGQAMATAQERLYGNQIDGVGMLWQRMRTLEDQQVIWHNGGTSGYVSFIGFDPEHQVAVVVLSNYGDAMAGNNDLDKLALQVLRDAAKVSLK